MGLWVSFEVEIHLRGRPLLVQVQDHYIQDGDVDEDGQLLTDELVFTYKVFDPEEEAEITQITTEEHEHIYKAIIADLQQICAD